MTSPSIPAPATPASSAPAQDDDVLGEGAAVHLDSRGEPRIIERRFVVEEAHAGARVDHYLKRMIPRLSRTKLQRIVKSQLVRGDGKRLKPHSPVRAGDELIIRRPARPEPPCPQHFDILYRDEAMMIVDKPPGLPVHASAKFYFNTLARLLRDRFPDEPVRICHRLDRETSGCLAVARSRDAAARLQRAFSDQRTAKAYVALVHGQPPWPDRPLDHPFLPADDDHVIDLPIGLVDPGPDVIAVRMIPRADAPPATTRVRVLDRQGELALVRCILITGRQHQIRAHLAHAGYPIVGDKLYAHGDEAFRRFCAEGLTPELLDCFELPRQALHAAYLRVPHPFEPITVEAKSPLPRDLRAFFRGRAASPSGL
jgi:23S rRNA pseudouridine1911/1915/1917 synthase